MTFLTYEQQRERREEIKKATEQKVTELYELDVHERVGVNR